MQLTLFAADKDCYGNLFTLANIVGNDQKFRKEIVKPLIKLSLKKATFANAQHVHYSPLLHQPCSIT